jgi:hypothetical protein
MANVNVAQAHWLFPDIDEVPWAQNSIINAYQMKIIEGEEDGGFHPQNNVSRAQFVKMIVRAENANFNTNPIEIATWYSPFLTEATRIGIMENALKDNKYDDPITRLEIARMVSRFLDTSLRFKKVEDEMAVSICTQSGILQGRENGNLSLDQPVSRAEAAVIIDRLLQKNGGYGKTFDTLLVNVENNAISLNGLTLGMHKTEVQAILGKPFHQGESELDGTLFEEYKNFIVDYSGDQVARIMYKAIATDLKDGSKNMEEIAVFKGFNTIYYYLDQSKQLFMIKDQASFLRLSDNNFYFHIKEGGIEPINNTAKGLEHLFKK